MSVPSLPSRLFTALALIVLACASTACQELGDLRVISEARQQRISELEREKEAISDELLQITRAKTGEIRDLEIRVEELEAQLREVRSDLTDAESALQQARDEAQTARAEAADQRSSLSETIQEQTGRLQSAQKEAAELEDELETARRTLDAAQREKEALEERADKAEAQLRALRESAGDLENQVAERGETIETLRAELEEARRSASEVPETASTTAGAEPVMDDAMRRAFESFQQSLKPVVEEGFGRVTADERGVVVALTANYLFQPDVLDLDPDVQPTLEQIARILGGVPDKYVEVVGHTDRQPIETLPFIDNWALGSARAQAVTRSLAEKSAMPESHFKSASASHFRPLPDAPAAMNRRVEIVLTNRP